MKYETHLLACRLSVGIAMNGNSLRSLWWNVSVICNIVLVIY